MSTNEITLFRTGDALFVQTLYAQQRAKLFAYAQCYLRDGDEADDAVAETWKVAWEHREQYRGDGPLEGWLLKICTSVCLNALRRRKREAKLLQNTELAEHPVDIDVRVIEAAAIAMQDVAIAVTTAIDTLPPRQRQTVSLRMIDNRSTAQVAETMCCAQGTVKANLHKAMKHLAPKTRAAVRTLTAARAALASGNPDSYV
jgi:RNA polymerase sigma-70 factor (ECF subfamily)